MSAIGQVKLRDSTGATVTHPAEDESIVLLRRMLKVLESNTNVDNLGRQRVAVEQSGAALGTSPQVTVYSGSVTIGSMNQLSGFASWLVLADNANAQYRTGIRSHLTW